MKPGDSTEYQEDEKEPESPVGLSKDDDSDYITSGNGNARPDGIRDTHRQGLQREGEEKSSPCTEQGIGDHG